MRRSLLHRLGLVAAVALAAGAWLWHGAPAGGRVSSGAQADAVWAHIPGPFGRGQVQTELATVAKSSPSPAPALDLGLDDSSLQGTQADGDWGVDARGQLSPTRSLRRRFDYYLSLVGERDLRAIDAFVSQQAKAAVPEQAAHAVLGVWQRYLRLQQHAWVHHVDPREPASWQVALQERQRVRANLLGQDWADAFFGEEERELQTEILRIQNGGAKPVEQPATFAADHGQANERVAQVNAQWAAWERRLDEARKAVSAIEASTNLSALQQSQAIEAYVEANFNSSERLRVRALLKI